MAHHTWTPPQFGQHTTEAEQASPEAPSTPEDTSAPGRHASPPDDSVIEHDPSAEAHPPVHDEVPPGDVTGSRSEAKTRTPDHEPTNEPEPPAESDAPDTTVVAAHSDQSPTRTGDHEEPDQLSEARPTPKTRKRALRQRHGNAREDDREQPEPVESKTTKTKLRKSRTRKRKDPATGQTFQVPVPGGRLRGERGLTVAVRATLLVLLGLTMVGAAFAAALVAINIAASEPDPGVTADELRTNYDMDPWPTADGASYASRYLEICLRRDPETRSADEAQIAAMNASTNVGACAWNGDGEQRQVRTTGFTGYSEPIPGMEDNARYIGVQVQTGPDGMATYVVPVWYDDPASSTGPRVIGPTSITPNATPGEPDPDLLPERQADSTLSEELAEDFLPQVMTAWATATDDEGDAMSQWLTPDATPAARAGLGERYQNVEVLEARAYPSESSVDDESSSGFSYTEGDQVDVEVRVNLIAAGDSQEQHTYRVTIVRSGSLWLVDDIKGSSVTGIGQDEEVR